ncbi:MAG: hypothetical protein AAGE76_13235 [Pseudomonadota bacterium]
MWVAALTALGRRARWILALGAVAALFLPGLSGALRPALPFLVALVLGLSMARIDLGATLRGAVRPRRLGLLLAVSALLIPATALVYGTLGRLFGPEIAASLVYLAAAPPIASAAGLCFMLGYNARLALEVTVAATLLTPILGPLATGLALPTSPLAVDPLRLGLRLAAMIAGGIAVGLILRRGIGADRIARHAPIFDGFAALGMLVFILPLFDRVGALILDAPWRAVWILAIAALFNLGANLATRTALGSLPATDRGAAGVVMGNRNVAMYLAALPFEPTFALFVALYQFPMYFTPLIFGARTPRDAGRAGA